MKATYRGGDAISYVMLFCALLLVKNSNATLDQVVTVVPLVGKVRVLAQELCGLPA